MILRNLIGCSLAALATAGVMFVTASTAQAAMSPAPASAYAATDTQEVGCLLGAHLGPLGACLGGEHRHRHCWIDRWGRQVCN
jgi:hypothetical protein